MLHQYVYGSKEVSSKNETVSGTISQTSLNLLSYRDYAAKIRLPFNWIKSRWSLTAIIVAVFILVPQIITTNANALQIRDIKIVSSRSGLDSSLYKMDYIDDLIDLLEDIDDDLDTADALVGTTAGELTGTTATDVASLLDSAEAIIDQILDPVQYPSLTPYDAGSIIQLFGPSTTTEYATDCRDLARDALDEAMSRILDDDVIGSDLKTIKHLLIGLRQQAGI